LVLLARSVEARYVPAQVWWASLKRYYPDLPFAQAAEQARKHPAGAAGASPLLALAPAKTPNVQALNEALNAALLANCSGAGAFIGNLQRGHGTAAALSAFGSARPKDDWCEVTAMHVSMGLRIRPPQSADCTPTSEGQATCRFPVSFVCRVAGAPFPPQTQMGDAVLCGTIHAIAPVARSGRFSRNPDGSWRLLSFD
jgi:hypothetical protein